MKRGKLLRPQCRISRNADEQSYTVSITIPEDWLDLDGATFHQQMDGTLGHLMQVFEAGRSERAAKRREEGGI
jgi:hypothetical protein